jgi:uncharacterized membrane protein HdeD (DUF308 family)
MEIGAKLATWTSADRSKEVTMVFLNELYRARALRAEVREAIERLRPRWGWIIALGALIAVMGALALALVVSATIASVYVIAIFMIVAGGAEIMTGIAARNWGRAFLWSLGGLLYIVAGAFALARPLVAAYAFTLILGVVMTTTGAIRIYLGTQLGTGLRGPVLWAGVLTALVGLLILIGWPSDSVFILGILLGLDLLFWGTAWIAFGLWLRSLPEAATS